MGIPITGMGKIAAHIGVPDEYKIVCILPVGIADEDVKRGSKIPFEQRIRFNGFDSARLGKE